MELYRIKQVQPEGGNKLQLPFDDGVTGLIDFDPVVRKGGGYAPLGDAALFRRFRLERNGRVLAWPDDIEFCADALWQAVSHGHERDASATTAWSSER